MDKSADIAVEEYDSSDVPVGYAAESAEDDNRRDCVRLSSVNDGQAVLTDGFTRVTVRCVNRSSGGFGMGCDKSIPWSVGESVLLNRSEGSYEVQIAYIREHDEEDPDDEDDGEQRDLGKFRIGVKCVQEYIAPPSTSPLRLLKGWMRRYRFFKIKGETLGICFVLLLCGAILAAVFLPSSPLNSDSNWLRDLTSSGQAKTRLTVLSDRNSGSDNRQSSDRQQSRTERQAGNDKSRSSVFANKQQISWADIEELLQLSKGQSKKLRTLLNSLFTANSAAQSNRSPDFGRALRSLSDDKLLFLSRKQRSRLRSMLTELQGK